MNGTISLTGLRAWGRHGVFAGERAGGQEFVVDAVLELDMSAAAATDDLAGTVDYGALADELVAVVTGRPVRLIETLAARLAECCLARDRVSSATITVHKPQAPVGHGVADVAVTLRRERGR